MVAHEFYRRRSDICDTSLRIGSNLIPSSANNIPLSVFSLSWYVHWCEYQRNLHVFLSRVFLLLSCQRIRAEPCRNFSCTEHLHSGRICQLTFSKSLYLSLMPQEGNLAFEESF